MYHSDRPWETKGGGGIERQKEKEKEKERSKQSSWADLASVDEGPVDPALTENSPQILHRKMFLRAYLTKLCSDPSTMEFWYYLDKVG